MLKILIYDTDQEATALIGTVIKTALKKVQCSFELSTYHNANKAIQNISGDAYYYDILLLKAEKSETAKLAQLIRETNLQASIIFISQNISLLPELLRFRPSGVIQNTEDKKHIIENFRIAYKEQRDITSYFTVKTRESIIKIRYNDILYFESHQRIVTLYTKKNINGISFYAKLDDVYNTLPKDLFLNCHKSYIVNMSTIERLNKVTKQFTLSSGQTVEISTRAYTDTAERFEVFCHLS